MISTKVKPARFARIFMTFLVSALNGVDQAAGGLYDFVGLSTYCPQPTAC
jgi:hypothetical protein